MPGQAQNTPIISLIYRLSFSAQHCIAFHSFFINPTFNAELVERERHAIDSEYRLKISDDVRRSYQVHKETVNPAHPFSKFSVGNLETLHENPGESLREEVKAFLNSTTVQIG